MCMSHVLAGSYLEDAGQLAHMESRSAETASEYDRLCSSSAALETAFSEPDDSVSHLQRYAQLQESRGGQKSLVLQNLQGSNPCLLCCHRCGVAELQAWGESALKQLAMEEVMARSLL